ncbi:hypothetical protein LCGC14_1281620 [marine sediment metagenome]|uniref:C2H2-type domain-containing protein n=1 Tax=marine sediment metagenome TaxID=412755 RepID=A0A0F9KV11_9ZZZZ
MPSERDEFYWEVLKVLQANGLSRARARALYLELNEVIEKQLVTGRLRIRGLVTVHVKARRERTRDGWTGDFKREKFVVRAGAKIGFRLKRLVTDRAKFAHLICPVCDTEFGEFEDLRFHMVDHETTQRPGP